MNCFRYLDFKSFDEVDRLTFPEYYLLMEAARLKNVDMTYREHLQAWLNFVVKARKGKQGKPVYKKFKQFFDYEAEIEKIKNIKNKDKEKGKFSGIGKLLNKEKGE